MEPGLYDEFENLIYTWYDLKNLELIQVEQGKLINCNTNNVGYKNILVIDDNIEIIAHNAFGDQYFSKIIFGENVCYMDESAFQTCVVENIDVNEYNPYFSSENGVLFNKNKTRLITYPSGKTNKSYIVPNSVKTINSYAFHTNMDLEEINLSRVENLEYRSFSKCFELKKVILPHTLKNAAVNCFLGIALKEIKYFGTKEEFNTIRGRDNLYCNLTIYDIEFKKSLEDLIKEGKSIKEANIILREYVDNIDRI